MIYTEKNGDDVMGVFDMTKKNGVSLSDKSVLLRHEMLHDLFKSFQTEGRVIPPNIRPHWIGYEVNCAQCWLDYEYCLPFQIHGMLRLEDLQYTRVLKPLKIKQ